MSKITKALKQASEERVNRLGAGPPITEKEEVLVKKTVEGKMENSRLIWFFVAMVVITVFIAFNYQGGKETVPLSEIFPEEEVPSVDIEYEFVKSGEEPTASPKAQRVVETPQAVSAGQREVVYKRPLLKKGLSVSNDSATASFTIQLASFKDKNRAEKFLGKVKGKGYAGYLVSRDLGEKGVRYRVYAGKFTMKDKAEEFLSEIRKDYPSSFIISLKKK